MTGKSTRPYLVATATLLATLCLLWLWPNASTKDDTIRGGDFALLSNRIWIDHIPTHERDKVHVFVLFDDPTFGGFSTSSAYEGDWTSFEWSLEKGLVLSMLQSKSKHQVHPKLKSGAACAPFDHCMKLKGAPRGPKTYGSMEDWVVNDASEFDTRTVVANIVAAYN